MHQRTILICLGLTATMSSACHEPANSIPEGDAIPDTDIVSCGDSLIDFAPPAGGFSANLVFDGERTLLEGSVIWQASCPDPSQGEETQFWLDSVTVYRDDAGYPGEELGSAPVDISAVLTCPSESKSQDFEPAEVVDLSGICADYMQDPAGTSLNFQVELTGRAITCSAEQHDLLFRRMLSLDCG